MWIFKSLAVAVAVVAVLVEPASAQNTAPTKAPTAVAEQICTTKTNTFTSGVNIFAGELGYYTFDECPGLVSPTIGVELGQSYTFLQTNLSSWLHPLGFAYFPDGGHANKDELEAVVTETNSTCAETFSCPHPQYYRNGTFLGVNGTADSGLDVYKAEFFAAPSDWTLVGPYSVVLKFDDANYTSDIFYFCHVHQYMTGRIKILKDGVPVSSTNVPELPYMYDVPGAFDQQCGTFGLDAYQLPNAQCPDKFVCVKNETSAGVKAFSTCIDAMNCAMMDGMTAGVLANSETALFIHQMIPHHQNAVNMAKALLSTNVLKCTNITMIDDPDCIMEEILRQIISDQNHQIQRMRGVLEARSYPATDNCLVEVNTVRITTQNGSTPSAPSPSNPNAPSSSTNLSSGADSLARAVLAAALVGTTTTTMMFVLPS